MPPLVPTIALTLLPAVLTLSALGCGPAADVDRPVTPVAHTGRRDSGGAYAERIRSTHYFAGETHSDPDTDAGRSATGVVLRPATATQVGVCAVDPAVIPYGSRVIVPTAAGPRSYVAADTGGAVKHETASRGSAHVVDFYSRTQVGRVYQSVTIIPYQGAIPFTRLTPAEKDRLFDMASVADRTGTGG